MEERVAEAAANKMTAEEKNAWYKQHLTMQAAPLSVTVAAAAEAANLMKDTQNLFVHQGGYTRLRCRRLRRRRILSPCRWTEVVAFRRSRVCLVPHRAT